MCPTTCHNLHSLAIDPKKCAVCHPNVIGSDDFKAIRNQKTDFDSDGDVAEGIYHEIAALHERLVATL